MGIKDRKNLRVIDGYKGTVKKKVGYYIERAKELLGKEAKKNVMIALVVAFVMALLFVAVNMQTFTTVKVQETIDIAGAGESSYRTFADGTLKYSRDGIAFLDMDGEEKWNFPCQIKTPFVETSNQSAAVADKGGNSIIVVQEEGVKGEIKTTLPIEKIAVSEQGIVCAILKQESSPQIICYDAAGNILVEHKTDFSGTGYPMDVAISADGKMMQVAYLYVYEGKLLSKVAYYNFGQADNVSPDHQVTCKEYENTIITTGFYMDNQTSVVVGDRCISIFEGKSRVEETVSIVFEEKIQCIGHSDKYIAVVLQKTGESGYELRVYNKNGKIVTSEMFTGSYRNIKICNNQIIMYDGKECTIFLKNGTQKFQGEMGSGILEIIPSAGMNKYTVINANGMESIRLAK